MTVTVTSTGGSEYMASAVTCYSGIATTSPLDQSSSMYISSATPTVWGPGSITPGQNGELIITSNNNANGNFVSVSAGFTKETNSAPTSTEVSYLADFVQTTAAAINPSWTFDIGYNMSSFIASFKPSGTVAPSTNAPLFGAEF
jgi:hypothetical protein